MLVFHIAGMKVSIDDTSWSLIDHRHAAINYGGPASSFEAAKTQAVTTALCLLPPRRRLDYAYLGVPLP